MCSVVCREVSKIHVQHSQNVFSSVLETNDDGNDDDDCEIKTDSGHENGKRLYV